MKTKSSSEAQKPVSGTLRVIETVIPGIRMIRTWHRRLLRVHLVTWVAIFAMLELQGITHGERAGVAPSRSWPVSCDWYYGLPCALWEFTTSDDWNRDIFRDPGGCNAVAGRY